MSVVVDMKRRSPTVPDKRDVLEFEDAAQFCSLLSKSRVDAFFVNTDEQEYGGRPGDLKTCVRTARAARPLSPAPCILKDVIVHPVQVTPLNSCVAQSSLRRVPFCFQIAQALEDGAAGALLIAAVVGADLAVLLDSCTIMGCEAVVEVHTPHELDFALSLGATLFVVNMWDRTTGVLHPEQVTNLTLLDSCCFIMDCRRVIGPCVGQHAAHEFSGPRRRRHPHRRAGGRAGLLWVRRGGAGPQHCRGESAGRCCSMCVPLCWLCRDLVHADDETSAGSTCVFHLCVRRCRI